MILGISRNTLAREGGTWTAQEIAQQPEMLSATREIVKGLSKNFSDFADGFCDKRENRIILTGAGTSAFVGDCLAPLLNSQLACRVEAVSTTDIACAPHIYLERDTPTLLVSFGRSGDSPESVAAVDLVDQFVSDARHLVITCNENGELCRRASVSDRLFSVLLPEKTHDQSFAMTSSFTCMMYAALHLLSKAQPSDKWHSATVDACSNMIDQYSLLLRSTAKESYERVVYLGSHCFKGLSNEAALKLLELSDGRIVAANESPLGFRHGPKTIINDRTLVVVFLSNDPTSRQYDLDLLREVHSDGIARVMAITTQPIDNFPEGQQIIVSALENGDDMQLLFPYIVAPQMLAFYSSLGFGLSPDNPNKAGLVNRVVKGVRIHAAS